MGLFCCSKHRPKLLRGKEVWRKSWKVHSKPFVMQNAAKSLPSMVGLYGRLSGSCVPKNVRVAKPHPEIRARGHGIHAQRPQHVVGAGGKREGERAASGLRLLHVETARATPQRMAYRYGAVIAPKCAHLATAHAGGKRKFYGHSQRRGLCAHGKRQHVGAVFAAKGVNGSFFALGRFAEVAHIFGFWAHSR